MPDVFKIADILVSHAKRAHGEDVAIISYCGSYATGQASPTSDLDIYYIPDDGKAASLSSQFVLDGLPYDFWPVSWKFAEDIANARSTRPWAVSASLIANARALHYRSQADLDRFNALKSRIAELTRPESRSLMVGYALEEFRTTLFQLGQMRLAANADDSTGLYRTGWEFGNSAVNCLALMNQTYFTRGWGANMSQILEMRQKPDGLEDMLKGVTATGIPSATLEQADRLASSVREMLRDAQLSLAEPSEAQEVFKDFYYFVFEYVGKVISTCDRKDAVAASYAALSLQDLICKLMAQVEHGYFPTELNLSGEYTAPYYAAGFPNLIESASRGDLMTLDAQTRQLDKMMRNWLSNHSVDLNILADNEHLRRFLNHRDPA